MDWFDFSAHGFTVSAGTRPAPPYGDGLANPIRLLEPYHPMAIRFCTTWGDTVPVTRDGSAYTAFGECPFGLFLRNDETGAIALYSLDRITFDTDYVEVNADLSLFVSCYSAFLAAVFMAKSRAARESGFSYRTDAANWMEERIQAMEPGALSEGTFWSHLTYYLDDNGVPLRANPIYG